MKVASRCEIFKWRILKVDGRQRTNCSKGILIYHHLWIISDAELMESIPIKYNEELRGLLVKIY